MAQAILTFPPDFKWGTTSAAYQVEGQNHNSDWWGFEQIKGAIVGDGRSGDACGWWPDPTPDLDQAAEMGTNALRLSIEWSRVEPEPSVFDRQVLGNYRNILQVCHDRGIEPMVTLHHFSNPHWLAEKGGFDSDLVIDYFRRFTTRVVDELGDLVPMWITFNEPIYYLYLRHVAGVFPPPTSQGWNALLRATSYLLSCHAAAYYTIKESYPQAKVSLAQYVTAMEPAAESNPLSGIWARLLSGFFNDALLDSLVSGRMNLPGGRRHIAHLAGTWDFVALDYYARSQVHFPSRNGLLERPWNGNESSGNSEKLGIYPYGLYKAIKKVNSRYGKDIYVTGNGLPDQSDQQRPSFILDHLLQIWHAISFCFPVMGYYHTSLIDSFEWDRGWTQQFGLIAFDPQNEKRDWRPSAHLYQEICQSYAISSDMVERYAPQLTEKMFPGSTPSEMKSS